MKTYGIFPTREIVIDGIAFTPDDQVGVVSVDGISLMSLLGAIQFQHCKAIELDEAEILRIVEDEGEEDEGSEDEQIIQGGDGSDESESSYVEGEPIEILVSEVTGATGGEESVEVSIDSSAQAPAQPSTLVEQLKADGVDEKIATTLAEQGVGPEQIRGLIAEGFDLTELEGIGKTRAEALISIYGPKT